MFEQEIEWADATAPPVGSHAPRGNGVAWIDYDYDGDDDLYVSNNGSQNKLYRNDGGGVFTDASLSPLNDPGYSTNAVWGDYDNNGLLDVYIGNCGQANKVLRNMGTYFSDWTVSPPDIARATGHNLGWVDSYLGPSDRIRVLLHRGPDVPTICQVTGRAPRTVEQYMVIVEHFHPELLDKTHRDWLKARRRKRSDEAMLPAGAMAPMVESLKGSSTLETRQGENAAPGRSSRADRKPRSETKPQSSGCGSRQARNHSPDICPKSR